MDFSPDACKRALDALHVFLSFANGQWATFVLVRGYTKDANLVWQEWGNRRVEDRIDILDVWFEPRHGDALAEAFPGFLDTWNRSEQWEGAVHTTCTGTYAATVAAPEKTAVCC